MTAPTHRPVRTVGAILVSAALALGGVLVAPVAAQAATLTVTSSADDGGGGTLRTVIAGSSPGDIITFDPSVSTILLTSGIDIDWSLTIDGGTGVTIGRANTNNFQQIAFTPEQPDQNLVLTHLSIEGVAGGTGAGLYASYGTNNNQPNDITLIDVEIMGQTKTFGAAISVYRVLGNILIQDSLFESNTATGGSGGGALYLEDVFGDMTIEDSIFSSNTADQGSGGAISVPNYVDTPDTLRIFRTTFQSNFAFGLGGAVYVGTVDGAVEIDSSTFTGDVVSDDGAGDALAIPEINGTVDIVNSTFNEQAGDGYVIFIATDGGVFRIAYSTVVGYVPLFLAAAFGSASVASSILDGLGSPAIDVDVPDDPVIVSYSILSSGPAGYIADNGGTQFSTAPNLGPLQDNGGPTFTRLPLAGSPAIDKGLPGGTPPSFDQRGAGFPRVIVGRVDVGAVETSYQLAATGQTLNLWIPIVGGVLLLGGIAAIVVSAIRRRRA